MGWLDSLWPSSRTDDPFGKLDPKLREYLEKESPVRYGGSSSSNTTTAPASTSRQPKTPTPAGIEAARRAFTESDKAEPAVPTESLYQDGRYAHLWKGYKPLAQIENETKSDHEKLMDVLEGFKDRKEQIGRAALENCALEQSDWRSCMSNPSVTERLTLCRTQVKKFEKCYTQQTRLLKALGYLSTLDRSPQVEEDIQMHADALYQKMQAQEAEIDAAKAEGRPLPTFEPLIPKRAVGSIGPERQLTPEQQADLRARLAKVPEEEKSAEEAAIRAEFKSKAEISARVHGLWEQQEKERIARKAKGEETYWDKVTGVFKTAEKPGTNDGTAEKK